MKLLISNNMQAHYHTVGGFLKDFSNFAQPYSVTLAGYRAKDRSSNKFNDYAFAMYYDNRGGCWNLLYTLRLKYIDNNDAIVVVNPTD